MILGVVGQPLLLDLVLADEAAGLFPQVTVFDDAGAVQTGPLDLADRGGGLYQVEWAVPVAGQFSAVFLTYTDAAHTIKAEYEAGLSHIRIETWESVADAVLDADVQDHLNAGSVGEAILLAAGHAGLYVRDDALTYDAEDRPLTFRRRIFPNEATAIASTPGATGEGEIVTLLVDAQHIDAARWQTLLRRRV